jgi:hypothetical protein
LNFTGFVWDDAVVEIAHVKSEVIVVDKFDVVDLLVDKLVAHAPALSFESMVEIAGLI